MGLSPDLGRMRTGFLMKRLREDGDRYRDLQSRNFHKNLRYPGVVCHLTLLLPHFTFRVSRLSFVAFVRSVPEGAWQNAEFLAGYESEGRAVSVPPSVTTQVEVVAARP